MYTDRNAPMFLGVAFLIVVLTSLAGGLTLTAATGSGSIPISW